jgi:hypothetical protein
VRALSDKSKKVREQALWLLARSGDPTAIPVLASWHPPTDWDAERRDRARRVIEREDKNEWVRGTPYSGVIPWFFSTEEAGSDKFKASVDRYIKRFAADLVPDLEQALGDLYLGPGEPASKPSVS